MKKNICFILLLLLLISCQQKTKVEEFDFSTRFEQTDGLETATYEEVIDYYEKLAKQYPEISINEIGETDSGKPLHLVLFSPSKIFDFDKMATKNVVLINNGIHPGEPDGIDASMMLLRDLVQNPEKALKYHNLVIAVIPIYNVGGALNRNSHSRVNQNGPKAHGFRGNSRNFDLNRDFVKADTKNAKSFHKIFHLLNPDVFIDNHVSNGADYQYAITHLFTQHNKLGNHLGEFIENEMRPSIEKSLLEKNIIITPYVNVWGKSPKDGFNQFFDHARYSTGYSTFFNSLGVMVETHMLKPYKQRVNQTYAFMEAMLAFTQNNGKEIKALRKNAVNEILEKKYYPISYKIANEKFDTLVFKGYEDSYIPSKVTNGKRLYYDKSRPYSLPIRYNNEYLPSDSIKIPRGYVLKNGWWNVIALLENNNIEYKIFSKDTSFVALEQYIKDYKTVDRPYEGHYLHYNTTIVSNQKKVEFKKGNIFIPVNQFGARYIIETLEARAKDSFFNWNFFDAVLQRKEGYSAYVFEDIAETLLSENQTLKDSLMAKIDGDSEFANNSRAQLDFVYKNSPYYESSYMKLPVYKVFD